jgi:hypothetical protein
MSDHDQQPRLFSVPGPETAESTVPIIWVFQRESAEVRIAHIADERLLVVAQPDAPAIQRRFATVEALVEYQAEVEARLRREGWTLHHVEPDRRSRADRRSRSRPAPDRRRS